MKEEVGAQDDQGVEGSSKTVLLSMPVPIHQLTFQLMFSLKLTRCHI
jgi:hypothetical protein